MQSSRLFSLSPFVAGVAVCLFAVPQTGAAQGLIWRLPKQEKFTILYYGKYTQTDEPAEAGGQKRVTVWDRELIVKSLGKASGYFHGKPVVCRRLEISVRTGRVVDGDIDEGPAGKRTYNVLVPESRIIGKTIDRDSIFVSMLPIATDKDGKIQGRKKIGDTAVQPIKSPVLQVFPVITLLTHYRTIIATAGQEPITVGGKEVAPDQYTRYTAKRVVESPSSRSTNEATFWVTKSDQSPTGLAQWKVTVTRETKNSAQDRKEFKKVTTIVTELFARRVEIDANPARGQ
ncbi:MAG: hypothetical protein ACE5KM_04395 [Planctomycetaceae bacterium]